MVNRTSSAQALLDRMEGLIGQGLIPAAMFHDQEIFELEKQRIFSRCWILLAHESEIPEVGDYVVREIADNSIIVVRDENGDIRAHLNVCRHRGAQVCRSEMGNTSHFRCPYHGWVFQNTGKLIGVPRMRDLYGEQFDTSAWGLVSVRVETYAGLIFGNLDPHAEPLLEYMGGFEWYLDYYLKVSGEMEVYGPPEKFVVDADWKIASENGCGDGYHTPSAHAFAFELGYFPSKAKTHGEGITAYFPGRGHGLSLGRTPGLERFPGFPEEIVRNIDRSFSPGQIEVFQDVRTHIGTMFPNLSMVSTVLSLEPGGKDYCRFWSIRIWHPLGPSKMQVISYCLVPRHASEAYKRASYQVYRLAFGISGTFEQDDIEIWTTISPKYRGTAVRDMVFPYEIGRHETPLADFPGPGVVLGHFISERNLLNMWETWYRYMREPSATIQGGA